MKVESVSKVEPFPYQRNKNTEITVCFARSKIFSWFSLCLFYTTTFSGKKESMSRILVKESHVSALISPITRVFLSLFLQMHDFSTFPARTIQTNGNQPLNFGNSGTSPHHCTPMGLAKSLTMATSSAKGVVGLNPLPWRRR